MDWLTAFLASNEGLAVKAAVAAAFLDFAVGVALSLSKGSFSLDNVAAFLRKHIAGRVFPLSLLAVAGYALGDVVWSLPAAAALTAYAGETAKSIWSSFTETPAEAAATVPVD